MTIEVNRPLSRVRNRINTIKPFVCVPHVWMMYAEHSRWFWYLLILELFQGILFLMMYSSGQNSRNSGKLKHTECATKDCTLHLSHWSHVLILQKRLEPCVKSKLLSFTKTHPCCSIFGGASCGTIFSLGFRSSVIAAWNSACSN